MHHGVPGFFSRYLDAGSLHFGGKQLGFSVERISQVRGIDETAMIPFWRIITLDERNLDDESLEEVNLLHVFWGPCWKMGDNFGRLVGRSSVLYLVSSRFWRVFTAHLWQWVLMHDLGRLLTGLRTLDREMKTRGWNIIKKKLRKKNFLREEL